MNLEFWLNVETSILKHRIRWLVEGYDNSNYFHAMIKDRECTNSIDRLIDDNGVMVFSRALIKGIILNFYKGLLGDCASSLQAVDFMVVRARPCLQGH